ncbi:MAG: VOC family protein [Elusimicrobiales bacterium]
MQNEAPRKFHITFYTQNPARLAGFWAYALKYTQKPPPAGFNSWEEFAAETGTAEQRVLVHPAGAMPPFLFWKVKTPKRAKNYMHLDVDAGGGPGVPLAERKKRVRAEAERLAAHGATRIREVECGDWFWIPMRDPDGNEFCLQ